MGETRHALFRRWSEVASRWFVLGCGLHIGIAAALIDEGEAVGAWIFLAIAAMHAIAAWHQAQHTQEEADAAH